ncbi:MAG: hypothetical protein HY226_05620 [Candidatus Vogelbacteria bacterium]|nr:hypothetical protein [Candidatus Vogelbacteria bacterium]
MAERTAPPEAGKPEAEACTEQPAASGAACKSRPAAAEEAYSYPRPGLVGSQAD